MSKKKKNPRLFGLNLSEDPVAAVWQLCEMRCTQPHCCSRHFSNQPRKRLPVCRGAGEEQFVTRLTLGHTKLLDSVGFFASHRTTSLLLSHRVPFPHSWGCCLLLLQGWGSWAIAATAGPFAAVQEGSLGPARVSRSIWHIFYRISPYIELFQF